MKIRIDKCCTFGMRKQSGSYIQFQPNLNVGDSSIPALEDGANFKYLGKFFDFLMNNSEIKNILEHRLTSLLKTTPTLKIKPQQKMQILRLYIPSQMNFDLRTYDISYTWITQVLDAKICNSVREWLELPISACVAETLSLPKAQGGMGIALMKETAAKHSGSVRGSSDSNFTLQTMTNLEYSSSPLQFTIIQPLTYSSKATHAERLQSKN